MVKKVVIEISQNEYENKAEEVIDINNDINEDMNCILNTIASIKDPTTKLHLFEYIKTIKLNLKRLKNDYIIYK
jgi:hypothetical protein